jgi:hypothetical protein
MPLAASGSCSSKYNLLVLDLVLAPQREYQVQYEHRMAPHPLGIVLTVIKGLSAYPKQSTQVTDAHSHDFIFLKLQNCLVPDFFRMGSCSSCSATSIIVCRARISRLACCRFCYSSSLRCCKACTSCFCVRVIARLTNKPVCSLSW